MHIRKFVKRGSLHIALPGLELAVFVSLMSLPTWLYVLSAVIKGMY